MIKFLNILLLVAPLFLAAQEKLEFFAENIDFKIDSSEFSVNGIYYFANHSDMEIMPQIYFPFAENADSVKIKSIFNLTYSREIKYRYSGNGIYFPIIVPANDTAIIHISYSQETTSENIYILKSTQTWGKPLDKASYSLTFDDSVAIDSFSYQPDKQVENVYYWRKEGFLPVTDFKIFIKE